MFTTKLKINQKDVITKRSTEYGISAALQNHIGYLRRYKKKLNLNSVMNDEMEFPQIANH